MDIPLPPAQAGNLFTPDSGMTDWIHYAFLSPDSELFNEDHIHLEDAHICVLWAYHENEKQGRRIIGTAEMPKIQKGWSGLRKRDQIEKWFGDVPDFIITLDAYYWMNSNNPARCALIEHELYHCGQATDEFGMPRFSKKTGQPVFTMIGHDVEEFIGVVRRYGPEASGVTELVRVANMGAEIAPAIVDGMCGQCGRKVA